jgi:F-type H+-transporting ATPase subunit epsilon
MAALFNFEVHTPYRLFFSEKVEAIDLILADGEIEVFANHSPFTAPTLSCILRIKNSKGQWRSAFVTDGILEVKDSKFKNVLMVDAAQWPEEIDREQSLLDKEQAEESLKSAVLKFEVDNARAKLRYAEFRLKTCETKA